MKRNTFGFIHVILVIAVVVIAIIILFLGKDKISSIVKIGKPSPSTNTDSSYVCPSGDSYIDCMPHPGQSQAPNPYNAWVTANCPNVKCVY